jgi:hypothetical protein
MGTAAGKRFFPMTRRGFPAATSLGLAAAGMAPAISPPVVARAHAV